MTKRFMLPLTLLLVAAGLGFGKRPVTIDDVGAERGEEGIRGLVWAPDERAFAYKKGGSLHVFEIEERKHRDVVKLAGLEQEAAPVPEPERFVWRNRRVRESDVQWFPGGARLLVKAGGDLFVVETGEETWKQLTRTNIDEADPKLSPDGRFVSFRRENDLYVLEVDSRKERRLTRDGSATIWNGRLDWVYPEELAIGSAHWWSPDSRHVAYYQFDVSPIGLYPHADLLQLEAVAEPQRYPKAGTPNANVKVGVVSASGGRTRWLDRVNGEEEIFGRVDWLPDSSAVAIIKLDRVQKRLEMLLAPLRGAARTLFVEEDEHWVNLTDNYRFLEQTPRLLWSSERDGYRHLYMKPLEGGEVAQITQGEWEVSSVNCVDEDSETVYYTSTEVSPLERHLYSIGFDGSGKRRLSSEPGMHGAAMSPACRYYSHSYSNMTAPDRTVLRDVSGSEVEVLRKPDEKTDREFDLAPLEIVEVKADDGAVLYAKLSRPANFEEGKKYPAIVMVYGGPHAQSVRNSWSGVDLRQALAHAGFVVWQLDNRGTAARGHAWETAVYRRFGVREMKDQVTGVKHLISMGFTDPDRVGVYGWSYGGYMTINSLVHAPDVFRAGVAGAPVTDWRNYDTIYTERYMGLPAVNEEGYRESSPVHFAGRLEGDLLLIHNIEDDNVLFQHTMQMAVELQKAGKPFEMMIYGQKSHGVTGVEGKHLNRQILSFFERALQRAR